MHRRLWLTPSQKLLQMVGRQRAHGLMLGPQQGGKLGSHQRGGLVGLAHRSFGEGRPAKDQKRRSCDGPGLVQAHMFRPSLFQQQCAGDANATAARAKAPKPIGLPMRQIHSQPAQNSGGFLPTAPEIIT